ncbi:MAG: transcriptional regulator [Candidatus Hermodarchaeota archaeon]
MDNGTTWETRRQKIITFIKEMGNPIDLKRILKEFEYRNKKTLINDVLSIAKTIRNEGKKLVVYPASCVACGYVFRQKKSDLKIPSKCPKCREQRIDWPSIQIV